MERELRQTLQAVRDTLLSKPVSPQVEAPADINLHYCGYVAETVVEQLPEDMDVEILEDGGRGYAHTWIRYNGRHYDAECIEGVADYRDLPFFRRHPEAANRVVPSTVDPSTLRNRGGKTLYPAIFSTDSEPEHVVFGHTDYWPHAVAGVILGLLLVLAGLAGEWTIQASVLRDTALTDALIFDLKVLGGLIALVSPIVFFSSLPGRWNCLAG